MIATSLMSDSIFYCSSKKKVLEVPVVPLSTQGMQHCIQWKESLSHGVPGPNHSIHVTLNIAALNCYSKVAGPSIPTGTVSHRSIKQPSLSNPGPAPPASASLVASSWAARAAGVWKFMRCQLGEKLLDLAL